ncbi:MAG: hypothetical protein FJZ00_05625 [Candidatus Sericytochromatia bacterium]|uniref:NHL repeat containing protein n=1 Tax=Candidatus Tanganyikabacteria bacterium TaxID=2961651 RepID=A0A938BMT3_9BACT|nr:hypothetical protein [Candidatus Tanganyikabacteria bacterium]
MAVNACLPLDVLNPKPPGDGVNLPDKVTPTAAPADGGGGTTPPAAPTAPVTLPPTPVPVGKLNLSQLGFLVSNNAAGIKGTVSGPSTLVSNNAAGLVSNNAAGLVSNNAAGLIANNAAGLVGGSGGSLVGGGGGALVGGSGGSYRVAAATIVNVAEGTVYFTTPDERFYVDANRNLIGQLTDKDGKFDLKGPSAKDVIINVLLSGNRRLTALVNTTAASDDIKVDVATTLATEYLRGKAQEFGFKLADVFADEAAPGILANITGITREFLASDAALAKLGPGDLAINNIPVLRQRYAVLLGSGSEKRLSNEWVKLLRALKKDSTSPDWIYRPIAVTTLDTGTAIPPGDQVLSVAVAPSGAPNAGKIYVATVNANRASLLEVPAGGGTPRSLLKKFRLGDGAWRSPGTLEVRSNGQVILMDALNQWIGYLDPAGNPAPEDEAGGGGYLGLSEWFNGDYSKWKNPKALVDVYCAIDCANGTDSSVDDMALDDAANPNLYFADLGNHAIWKVAAPFTNSPDKAATVFAGKSKEVFTGIAVANTAAALRFNQPAKVTFHKKDGVSWLYVADGGDHIVVRINVATGAAERVAGQVPPETFKFETGTKKGVREALCYDPAEEGQTALGAHLRFPQKMLFDSQNRMLLADSDNRLIRIATVYDSQPKVWTLAGIPPKTNDRCEAIGLPPPFANEDGEARKVALGETQGMSFDPEGNLILSDVRTNRVRKIWTSFLQ